MNEALDNNIEVICSGTVKDFEKFLTAYDAVDTFPGEVFVLMEQQPTALVSQKDRQNLLLFERYSKEAVKKAVNYTTGRIFSQGFELRWERRPHDTWMVYIGSKQYAPALANGQEIPKEYQRLSRSYYLYGTPLDDTQIERIGGSAKAGDFAEARIPRLLRYPSTNEAGTKMRLEIDEYIDTQTGQLIFFRFTGRRKVQL
jgi:hypothetical protein